MTNKGGGSKGKGRGGGVERDRDRFSVGSGESLNTPRSRPGEGVQAPNTGARSKRTIDERSPRDGPEDRQTRQRRESGGSDRGEDRDRRSNGGDRVAVAREGTGEVGRTGSGEGRGTGGGGGDEGRERRDRDAVVGERAGGGGSGDRRENAGSGRGVGSERRDRESESGESEEEGDMEMGEEGEEGGVEEGGEREQVVDLEELNEFQWGEVFRRIEQTMERDSADLVHRVPEAVRGDVREGMRKMMDRVRDNFNPVSDGVVRERQVREEEEKKISGRVARVEE